MTSAQPRVVVVGSLNRDYVCTVERLPSTGETVLGSELELHAGGKGSNQAVAAAVVGAVVGVPCAIVGAVGRDADGAALLDGLRGAGVDTTSVAELPDVRTGAALITVDAAGANTIVVSPGANHRLDERGVARALDALVDEDGIVVLQGELTAAVTESAVRLAARAGARVVVNLAPVRPLPEELMARCDPLVVNESEAAGLVGAVSGSGARATPAQAAALLGSRAASAVVTAGAAGVVVAVNGTITSVPAPVTEVVDSTGAGDAFTGALAAGLARGRDLVTAARWGVAVASYSVGRPGAQASYPRGDACEALLAERGP